MHLWISYIDMVVTVIGNDNIDSNAMWSTPTM